MEFSGSNKTRAFVVLNLFLLVLPSTGVGKGDHPVGHTAPFLVSFDRQARQTTMKTSFSAKLAGAKDPDNFLKIGKWKLSKEGEASISRSELHLKVHRVQKKCDA